jgi:hypothetical protein
MKVMKRSLLIYLILFGVITLILWSCLTPAISEALPTRPEDVPQGREDGEQGDEDDKPVGAYLELHVPKAPPGAWTVVQWQNELDDWYDVAGWRGTLDEQGRRRWWVAKKDFGTGPFRWVVKQGPNGSVLGSSRPFDLPFEANQTLPVEVKL